MLRPILDAGGTVELAYYGMDGHAFGTIGVTRKSCQL